MADAPRRRAGDGASRSGQPVRGRFGREDPSRLREAFPPRPAFSAPGDGDPHAPVGPGGGADGPEQPPPGWDPADDYRGGDPPPGWEARDRHAGPGAAAPDLAAVLAVLEGLRGAVPRELQDQLGSLLRELLLAVRSLIDWYLERLDGPAPEPEVEDIPID